MCETIKAKIMKRRTLRPTPSGLTKVLGDYTILDVRLGVTEFSRFWFLGFGHPE